MIRTAIYCRVSTEDQFRKGLSLPAQQASLEEYAEKHDLTVVGKYIDEGITARKALTKRKALMRLLEDVKADKIDLIIFIKLDRWFRNVYDYHKVQEILEQHKVHWKTTQESYDTSTSSGRLHINIMLSVAQDEADKDSERIKFVFDNKVKNGEYLNNKVPFGYRVENSKVYKDEEKKHIAEDMFRKFFEIHSIRGTQLYLTEKYGIVFDQRSFRKIFKNTLYFGEYRGVQNFCEPYITREQFDEIQKIMGEKLSKISSSGIGYVFSGLLICPECEGRLGGLYARRGPGGSQRISSYRCSKHIKSNSCSFNKQIMEKTIEEYLFKNILTKLDEEKEKYDLRLSEKKQQKKVSPEKEIEKIKKKLSKLKDLYVNDMIDLDEYKKDYDEMNRKLDELTSETEEEEAQIDFEAIKKLLSKSTEEIYHTLPVEKKRAFWNSFIDRIVVHDRNDMDVIFLRKDTY